jgi:parallel beta-helix repeat protein
MISRNAERKCAILVALSMAVAVAFAACGGGGGDGTSGGSSGTPGGGHTKTPAATQPTQGVQATPTPTLTPIATATGNPTVIVRGDNISKAVHDAAPGSTVIVRPGKYSAFTLSAADLQGPITLLADVTGTLTETSPAPVVVDAALGAAAIALSNIPENKAVVIDGFTLRNGTTAGIVVDDSAGTTIQNCTFESNPGDGVRFSGAAGSLLFNNLIINNSGAGVQAIRTDQVEIFNNTFYQNDTGISIGDSLNVVVENNIINENPPFGIVVAADSLYGYYGDYNLNYNVGNGAPYSPMSIMGAHDLMEMPQFIDPTNLYPDFHLAAISPAIDAGDPSTPADLLSLLQEKTTQAGHTPEPDCGLPDLGYHYPNPTGQVCGAATPVISPTKKKTPAPTRTPH